jgi:hypothetical protein
LGGGLGFAFGDFFNKVDKVRWEPLYQHEFLRGFDHWKWSEQGFGLVMGAIMSLGVFHLVRHGLAPPQDDEPPSARIRTDEFSLFGLLVVVFWWNFKLNSRNIFENGRITDMTLFGFKAPFWMFVLGVLYVLLVLYLMRRNRLEPLDITPATTLGKGQLLFLFFMWTSVLAVVMKAWPLQSRGLLFVHLSFCLSAAVCSWLVMTRSRSTVREVTGGRPREDARWCGQSPHVILWATVWILVPALIAALSWVTMQMHDAPGDGFRYRFGPEAYHLQEPNGRT